MQLVKEKLQQLFFQQPERLDLLAYRFYGDASKWWIIASANGLGKGTLFVPENTTVRIPIDERIQDNIEQTNNSR